MVTGDEINKLNIFDLDTTLWELDQKVWIIDKDNPSIPILKINESDFNLIKSGIFRNQNNKVRFNGEEFYLPNSMVNLLKIKIKKENANIENLGVSLQEYLDKEIIDNTKFKILLDNITHIKNKNENIYAVTTRTTKEKYTKVLKKLEDNMLEEGLKIKQFYFINETFYNRDKDDNSYKKSLIILEHLTGYKISNSEFTEDTCEFGDVDFYDGIYKNINDIKYNLQDILDKIYNSTENNIIKEDILNKLKNKLECKLIYVTTNEVNRFIENIIYLKEPKKIMMFENFKNNIKDI